MAQEAIRGLVTRPRLARADGCSHYAGTLVLRDVLAVDGSAKTSVSDDGATLRHSEVVTGQQRLITCLLLLDRVRRRPNVLAGQEAEYAVDVATRIRTT